MDLCLCMIVRDEIAVIDRCLESAREVVDRWLIIDTGSTDGTQDRIRELLGGVPGELLERPWVDFGTNLTELLDEAAVLCPDDQLLLRLDADMTVESSGEVELEGGIQALNVPVEGDADEAGAIAHRLPLITVADGRWAYRGATHEYLVRDDGGLGRRAPTDAIRVVHHADGGMRENKLDRDRELLQKAVRQGREVPRSTFYLAQTEQFRGTLGKAMNLYVRRAELGGWPEEVFVALIRGARLAIALDDWDKALALLWRAFDLRPARGAEALFEIAQEARQRGQERLAMIAASVGVEIERPDDAILFVADWVYRFGMLFEYAIASQRNANFTQAQESYDRLLAMDDLPDHVRNAVYTNAALMTEAAGGQPAAT